MRLRAATAADYPVFARLYLELGGEFPVPTEAEWRGDLAEKAIVAEAGGAVIGYVAGAPFGDRGHVSQLVVDVPARRTGVARQLLEALGARFRAAGCTSWQLNVKRDNVAALALYGRMGFSCTSFTRWVRLPVDAVARLGPAVPVSLRPPQPGEDAALETGFGLRRGLLAWVRSLNDARPICVEGEAGRLVGFAVFVRANGAVVPLRIADDRVLGAVLAQLAPAVDRFELAVEDDEARVERLLALGGRVTWETELHVADLLGT